MLGSPNIDGSQNTSSNLVTLGLPLTRLKRQGDALMLRTSTQLYLFLAPIVSHTASSGLAMALEAGRTPVALLWWPQAFIHTCRNPSVLWAGGARQWPACAPHSSGSPDDTESAEMALWRDDGQRQAEVTLGLKRSTSWSLFAINLGISFCSQAQPSWWGCLCSWHNTSS